MLLMLHKMAGSMEKMHKLEGQLQIPYHPVNNCVLCYNVFSAVLVGFQHSL